VELSEEGETEWPQPTPNDGECRRKENVALVSYQLQREHLEASATTNESVKRYDKALRPETLHRLKYSTDESIILPWTRETYLSLPTLRSLNHSL